MANPSWVTSQNVRFDGSFQNAAVLDVTNNVRSLILWDELSVADQLLLTDVVNQFGGTTPIASPTAGNTTVKYGSAVTGSTATGLSAAVATSGSATINVGGNKTGTSPSGIPNAHVNEGSPATAGTATLSFTGNLQPTDNIQYSALTNGEQTVSFASALVTSTSTGLSNAGTTYTVDVAVNGAAPIHVSLTGNLITTFGQLQTQLQTALGAVANVTLAANKVVIDSKTTGTSSLVAISNDTMFGVMTGFTVINAATPGTGVAAFSINVTVDAGTANVVNITRTNGGTLAQLAATIRTTVGSTATVAVLPPANGHTAVVITSATTGITSHITVADVNFLSNIIPPVVATASTGTALVPPSDVGAKGPVFHRAVIVVDNEQSFNVSNANFNNATFQDVVTELNAHISTRAAAAIVGGNLVITSLATGYKSSIKVLDSGSFFSKLTSYAGIVSVQGQSVNKFQLSLFADAVEFDVFVDGSAAQTFGQLITLVNAVINTKATAAIVGGNLVITSSTTGAASSVTVVVDTLFPLTTGYAGKQFVAGTTSLVKAMQQKHSPNGSTLFEHFPVIKVGTKPVVLPNTPHNIHFVYFDGTVWKYLDNDANV